MKSSNTGRSIGDLARVSGVNLETVRYYERIGLMPSPPRTEGGHRIYGDEHRRRLDFIRRGRNLGFTLEDIRTLLQLSETCSQPCGAVVEIASAHLSSVQARLAELTRLEEKLSAAVARCGEDPRNPGCPVIEMLEHDIPPSPPS